MISSINDGKSIKKILTWTFLCCDFKLCTYAGKKNTFRTISNSVENWKTKNSNRRGKLTQTVREAVKKFCFQIFWNFAVKQKTFFFFFFVHKQRIFNDLVDFLNNIFDGIHSTCDWHFIIFPTSRKYLW